MQVDGASVGLEGSLTFSGLPRDRLQRRSDAICAAVAGAARVEAAAVTLNFGQEADDGSVRVAYAVRVGRGAARAAQARLDALAPAAVDAALVAAAAPPPAPPRGPFAPPRAALEASDPASADGARLRRPPRVIAVDEVACLSLSALSHGARRPRRVAARAIPRGAAFPGRAGTGARRSGARTATRRSRGASRRAACGRRA